MPTQVVSRNQPIVATTRGSSPAALYAIIGILATSLVAVGVYLIFLRDNPKPNDAIISTSPQPKESPSPSATINNVTEAPRRPPVPIDPNLTPAGSWSGDWIHNKRTSAFTAKMELQHTDGRVDGRIVWTLTNHANPSKSYKTGLTAVEFVRGTFDPVTRLVKIRGFRKDDPNNIIIYDSYNLSLGADSRTLSGTSKNGVFRLSK